MLTKILIQITHLSSASLSMFSEPNNLPFPLLVFNVTCEIRLDQTSSLLKLNAVDCPLCVAIMQWLYSTNQEGEGGGLLSHNFSFRDSSAFVICCIR